MFSFPNRSKKLFTVATRDNPRALCEISPLRLSQGSEELMVFPGMTNVIVLKERQRTISK